MQLPSALITSLRGLPGFDEAAFLQVHESNEKITSVRINPSKTDQLPFPVNSIPVPWTRYGFYLPERPSFTFDPLFHAGCYYVQEASSMFLEQALLQTADCRQPLKVLDLCAAPGGKTTHLHALLHPDSLLVSNEVIRSRAAVLRDNVVKWGAENIAVTNNDPKDFEGLPGFFDVMVVDAPCSGSGLFRRDEEAIGEWSENNVVLCSQRQQRILADVLPALKEDGILIYSTCSYSKEEDEDLLQWLTAAAGLEGVELKIEAQWNIIPVRAGGAFGYRFWPHLLDGEGFFMGVFRKKSTAATLGKYRASAKALPAKERVPLEKWISTDACRFVSFGGKVYGWKEVLFESFDLVAQKLRVLYSGLLTGELMRDKLVPDHALALSGKTTDHIPRIALPEATAIRYLQRKDITLEAAQKGWQLATFKEHPLGWVNVLPNRVNNYYPKELRILKEQPLKGH